MNTDKALLLVDVQNDFCPGGALAVPEGDKVVVVLNKYIRDFSRAGLPVFASRDWHPQETSHFKSGGGPWPAHCVRGTEGAAFHPGLELTDEMVIISKGMDPEADSYSAFLGFDDRGRPFPELLQKLGIKELFVGGLATDYCVKASVLHALQAGLKTWLLTDAVRGVNVNTDDSEKAVREMEEEGALKIRHEDLRIS